MKLIKKVILCSEDVAMKEWEEEVMRLEAWRKENTVVVCEEKDGFWVLQGPHQENPTFYSAAEVKYLKFPVPESKEALEFEGPFGPSKIWKGTKTFQATKTPHVAFPEKPEPTEVWKASKGQIADVLNQHGFSWTAFDVPSPKEGMVEVSSRKTLRKGELHNYRKIELITDGGCFSLYGWDQEVFFLTFRFTPEGYEVYENSEIKFVRDNENSRLPGGSGGEPKTSMESDGFWNK